MALMCTKIDIQNEDTAYTDMRHMKMHFESLREINTKISEELNSNEWKGAAPEGCLAAHTYLTGYLSELQEICDDLCNAMSKLTNNIDTFAYSDSLVTKFKNE